jgi:hypothetical protein
MFKRNTISETGLIALSVAKSIADYLTSKSPDGTRSDRDDWTLSLPREPVKKASWSTEPTGENKDFRVINVDLQLPRYI